MFNTSQLREIEEGVAAALGHEVGEQLEFTEDQLRDLADKAAKMLTDSVALITDQLAVKVSLSQQKDGGALMNVDWLTVNELGAINGGEDTDVGE